MNEMIILIVVSAAFVLSVLFYVSSAVLFIVAAIRAIGRKRITAHIVFCVILLVFAVALTVILRIGFKATYAPPVTDYPTYQV